MNKWLNKLKVKAILPVAALLAAAAIGTTFAWQHWELSVTNELKAHTTQVEVSEDFTDKTLKKEVKFTNTGSSSVFLRVAYSEYWEKDGKILSNTVNGKPIAQKKWKDVWTGTNPKVSAEWTHCSDGWSYYNTSLKPQDATNVILAEAKVNSADLPEEYVGANYHLYFKVEVVQCSDGFHTANSDEVNVAAINQVFAKSLTKSNLSVTNAGGEKVYTVTWPGKVAWKDFKGGSE